MNYTLLIGPFAEIDLKEAKDWYDLQRDDLGAEFIGEIKNTIYRIQENPEQFPFIKSGIRKAIVKRFPFVIFFSVNDELINVFAVFHVSRNPMIWNNRSKAK